MINIGQKGKKKVILAVVLLIVTAFSFVGIVFSYFSDTIEQSTNITIGTLKISGSYQFVVNGELVTDEIENLNPGDIINVSGNITNNGNKSAWIREKIDFGSSDEAILNYLEVYEGNLSLSEIKDEENAPLLLTDGVSVSNNKVINGSGNAAEVETATEYSLLNDYTYSFDFTIYFSTEATNEAQGKNFNINFSVQALQFRNNSVSEPTELAWSTVASAS